MNEHDEVKIEPEIGEGEGCPECEVEPVDEESSAAAKHVKLKKDLESARKEKQEYMDGWQRAKADYVNALKRFEEEKKAERTRGVVKAAEALLPAFDALERAKAHSELPEGFAGIVKQLESGFSSLGLESFGAVGEAFNPVLHDALGQDVTDAAEKDETVSAVLEPGWKIGDSVIRPAKVRVFQAAR